MYSETKHLIEDIKKALGKGEFILAVDDGLGPDGDKNPDYWLKVEERAEKLLALALDDKEELGKLLSKQLLKHIDECLKKRDIKNELTTTDI